MQKITTFFMFGGNAQEAMDFYTSLFNNSLITSITRYGPGEAGAEGTVMHATFSLDGQEFMSCETKEEIDRLLARLSEGGQVLMLLDCYPFSRKFAWVADRYGVSWQLSMQ